MRLISAAPLAWRPLALAGAGALALLAAASAAGAGSAAAGAAALAAAAGAAVAARRGRRAPGACALAVAERLPLGRDGGVALLDAGGRRLLLGWGPGGVTLLAELPPPSGAAAAPAPEAEP